jgi:mannose-6-phosphate isomerase-like protein (cupin superfamily)
MPLFLIILSGNALLLLVIAPLLDRVVFPEPAPGPELVPPAGYVFHSELEGVTMEILEHKDGLLWVEAKLRPYAPGPPLHVHTKFPELFRCERGVISMQVGDKVVELHPGEEYLVPPGVPHHPFNATGEEAVMRGTESPAYALPAQFGIFLSQAYGFFDENPKNMVPPRVILQMSRFAPTFDSWLATPPLPIQKATFWVLGPIARLLGYRTHYAKYAPKPVGSVMQPVADLRC